MSSIESPRRLLGKQETLTLEFKAAEALKKPTRIAREVVGMLNASGGTVWIGIPEENGRAAPLEEIPDVDSARESLRNSLMDTIEPSPTDAEVRCDVREGIIGVSINGEPSKRPYALRKDQGRQFWIRVDNVVREMTREEIAHAFGVKATASRAKSKGDRDEIEDAKRRLDDDWLEEHRRGRQRLWWELIPVPALSIDSRNEDEKKFLQALLTEPNESGNRRNGWSVVYFHDRLPKVRADGGIVHKFGEGKAEHLVEIGADGRMTFAVPRVRLDRNWDDKGTDLFPFALLEFPVSSFRVAARVLEHFGGSMGQDRKVFCSAAIGDIPGVRLRPGSPNEPLLPWKQFGTPVEDRVAVSHLVFQAAEIISSPDAAAYRLVWAIYEQFQLEEEDIPSEFDRRDKILRFS